MRGRLADWWLARTMVGALRVAAWCWARLRPAAQERFRRNQRPGDRAAAAYDAMARRADDAARQQERGMDDDGAA